MNKARLAWYNARRGKALRGPDEGIDVVENIRWTTRYGTPTRIIKTSPNGVDSEQVAREKAIRHELSSCSSIVPGLSFLEKISSTKCVDGEMDVQPRPVA